MLPIDDSLVHPSITHFSTALRRLSTAQTLNSATSLSRSLALALILDISHHQLQGEGRGDGDQMMEEDSHLRGGRAESSLGKFYV